MTLRSLRILCWLLPAALLLAAGCRSSVVTGPGDGGRSGSIQIDGDGRVELEGFIEATESDRIVVFGYAVLVDGETRIDGDHGDSLRLRDLLVGMWVEVDGTLGAGKTVLAERIDVEVYDGDGMAPEETTGYGDPVLP